MDDEEETLEGLLPLENGSNPPKNNTEIETIQLLERAVKKYRDKLIGEKAAWAAKIRSGRGKESTNQRHIDNLSLEIEKIESALA